MLPKINRDPPRDNQVASRPYPGEEASHAGDNSPAAVVEVKPVDLACRFHHWLRRRAGRPPSWEPRTLKAGVLGWLRRFTFWELHRFAGRPPSAGITRKSMAIFSDDDHRLPQGNAQVQFWVGSRQGEIIIREEGDLDVVINSGVEARSIEGSIPAARSWRVPPTKHLAGQRPESGLQHPDVAASARPSTPGSAAFSTAAWPRPAGGA